jgi:hypothetical protein
MLNYNGSLGTGPATGAIRDVAGKLLRTFAITGHQTLILLDGLPNGMYLCTLQVEQQPLYTIRLVVLKG